MRGREEKEDDRGGSFVHSEEKNDIDPIWTTKGEEAVERLVGGSSKQSNSPPVKKFGKRSVQILRKTRTLSPLASPFFFEANLQQV